MIIGVTGGVGTGKSTILSILKEKYDAAIIMADEVSKELMMPGESCYNAAVECFGNEILTNGPGSLIDRSKLAAIVFNDSEKLNLLNSINHPLVRKRIEELLVQYKAENRRIIVIETAILIQVGYMDLIDELWLITTDYHVRVNRLRESRGYSAEKTDNIISNQLSDDEMRKYADYVIDNSGSLENAQSQIYNRLNYAGIID